MAKNIEMNYKQGESEYEVLYPNVKVENVIDIEEHYYTKNEINGQISDIIPNPYGVLAIKATDDEGNPVSVQLTVNPKINNSSTITTDSGSGLFVVFVNPGTYNLTAPAGSDFIEYNIDVPNAQVKTNQVTNVNVGVNVVQSGELEITSSKTIQFPASFNIPVDIWGCGGGASGNIVRNLNSANFAEEGHWAMGGSSGANTLFITNQNVSNQQVTITIGNGAGAITLLEENALDSEIETGRNGGNTSVKIGNNSAISASGGLCGDYDVDTGVSRGGAIGKNGGSGGGTGSYYLVSRNEYTMRAGSGGSNGSDGGGTSYGDRSQKGGTGQGVNTHILRDSSKTLCCSATGGIAFADDERDIVYGTSGQGAGSNYVKYVHTQNGTYIADSASTYGSSGGHIVMNGWIGRSGDYLRSGAGKQGVVFIRWPSQST